LFVGDRAWQDQSSWEHEEKNRTDKTKLNGNTRAPMTLDCRAFFLKQCAFLGLKIKMLPPRIHICRGSQGNTYGMAIRNIEMDEEVLSTTHDEHINETKVATAACNSGCKGPHPRLPYPRRC
jgi:hypothetical protein